MTASPPTPTASLLSYTGKTARDQLATELAAEGLRLWHMTVLAALSDFGPHAQRGLAQRLDVDPSDLVKVLDELAEPGYVERSRDPADRRRVLVTLTPAGEHCLTALIGRAEAAQDAMLAPLNREDRIRLHALLLRVHQAGSATCS